MSGSGSAPPELVVTEPGSENIDAVPPAIGRGKALPKRQAAGACNGSRSSRNAPQSVLIPRAMTPTYPPLSCKAHF